MKIMFLCVHIQFHTNFVNVARFSPDGAVAVSGGADGKVTASIYNW
jgi:hypothetical protein